MAVSSNGHRTVDKFLYPTIEVEEELTDAERLEKIEEALKEAERKSGEGYEECFVPTQRVDPKPFQERADECVTPVEALEDLLVKNERLLWHPNGRPRKRKIREAVKPLLLTPDEYRRIYDAIAIGKRDSTVEARVTARAVADSFRENGKAAA
jgi:hypothetical protein